MNLHGNETLVEDLETFCDEFDVSHAELIRVLPNERVSQIVELAADQRQRSHRDNQCQIDDPEQVRFSLIWDSVKHLDHGQVIASVLTRRKQEYIHFREPQGYLILELFDR